MNLKKIRLTKEKTQTEVAKAVNITQFTYSNYENGKTEPTIETIIKLADYYKITIDELLGHEVPYLIDKSLLSEKQIKVINLIQKLSDYQCDRVESYIMGLSMAELERKQTIDKFNNRGE